MRVTDLQKSIIASCIALVQEEVLIKNGDSRLCLKVKSVEFDQNGVCFRFYDSSIRYVCTYDNLCKNAIPVKKKYVIISDKDELCEGDALKFISFGDNSVYEKVLYIENGFAYTNASNKYKSIGLIESKIYDKVERLRRIEW